MGKHTQGNHGREVREGMKPSGDSAPTVSTINKHMLNMVKAKENRETGEQPQ